jgi:hypothetical protein
VCRKIIVLGMTTLQIETRGTTVTCFKSSRALCAPQQNNSRKVSSWFLGNGVAMMKHVRSEFSLSVETD